MCREGTALVHEVERLCPIRAPNDIVDTCSLAEDLRRRLYAPPPTGS